MDWQLLADLATAAVMLMGACVGLCVLAACLGRR